jgi:hypothetical protein
MLRILEMKHAEGSVEAERALRNFADEWSSVEMLEEKLFCLKNARNMAELMNFIQVMSSEGATLRTRLEQLHRSWKLSQPKPSGSLVHWSELLSYRQNFHVLIPEENRMDGATHLSHIKQSLIDVAFAQKSCDAAKFMINGMRDEIRMNPTDEMVCKYKVAVAKYSLMVAEQRITIPEAQIERLLKGFENLIGGVINKPTSLQFPQVMIESLCVASEIAIKIWKLHDKCRSEGNLEIFDAPLEKITRLIDAIDDDNSNVADHLQRYSERSLKNARKWAQKLLDDSYSLERETILADTYLRLGQFYHNIYGSGTITVSSPEFAQFPKFSSIIFSATVD